jgi:hypothetical protein
MRGRPRRSCPNPGRPCHADCRSAGWAGALLRRPRRGAASMKPEFESQLPGRRPCQARPHSKSGRGSPPNACTPPPQNRRAAFGATRRRCRLPATTGRAARPAGVQARATGMPLGASGAANSPVEASAGARRCAPAQAWPARAGTCARRLRANAHSPMPVLARGRVIRSIASRRAHGV